MKQLRLVLQIKDSAGNRAYVDEVLKRIRDISLPLHGFSDVLKVEEVNLIMLQTTRPIADIDYVI